MDNLREKITQELYDFNVHADITNEDLAKHLLRAIIESSGILFTGKGASGKTTLMNACLAHIPQANSMSEAMKGISGREYVTYPMCIDCPAGCPLDR